MRESVDVSVCAKSQEIGLACNKIIAGVKAVPSMTGTAYWHWLEKEYIRDDHKQILIENEEWKSRSQGITAVSILA